MTVRIILVHGYASDGDEMMRLFGPFLRRQGYECSAPDGPFRCDLVADKRQWFALTALPHILAQRVTLAADNLDRELGASHLEGPTILIGHSQGAMIAADLVARSLMPNIHAVCVSGSLSFAAHFPKEAAKRTIFVHGQDDVMIPLIELERQLQHFEALDRLIRVGTNGHALDEPIVSQAVIAACNLAEQIAQDGCMQS